jgi:glycosyltransferase involved in cell wall biosynthesis
MNISPLVSVLTTVYNREKYLAACIESVLACSFQDWEMIIIDDQSKDSSVAIAQQYADQDRRIHVYVNETNLGDYPNRNQAAVYAKGKYLKYLDADDLIYPHGLEIMVETMEAHPECALGISLEVAEDF